MIASIIGGLFGIFVLLLGAVVSLAGFAFWLWMLIHAITNKGLPDGERVVWVSDNIFLPFEGTIINKNNPPPKCRSAVGA
jgi:hypothetical protein